MSKRTREATTNPSGIRPKGYCVLVKQHESDRMLGKSKSIIAPDQYKERADGAVTRGQIIAMSPAAFNYTNWGDEGPPKVGDIIHFKRYANAQCEGADGVTYWLIEDKSVQAVLDPAAWGIVTETAHAA